MLPIRFNVSPVTRTRTVADIRVINKDEYRNLIYIASPRPDQIPISFIGMPDPTPRDIEVVDSNEDPRALTIVENSFRDRVQRFVEAKNFILPVKSALITDVQNTDTRGQPLPLFYKHRITDGIDSIPQVLDADQVQVPGDKFKIVVEGNNTDVYHSLFPRVNFENLQTSVYYIRYTNSAGEQVFSILEADSAYSKANLEEGIDPRRRIYSVRKIGAGFEYRIFYRGNGPFFLKVEEQHQLKIKKPLFIRSNDAWNISISDGEVIAVGEGGGKHYSLPEFHIQQFSPLEPIKYSSTSECIVVSEHLAKMPFENVLVDGEHKVDILVTDKALNPKFGWTTGPTTPTPYWIDRFDRLRPRGGIVRFPLISSVGKGISIGKTFGMVSIGEPLASDDRVFVRAYYESKDYKYLGLNLNPLHNRPLVGGRAILYCLPDSEINEDLRALYHFILDEDNSIISWNDDRLGAGGILLEGLEPTEEATGYELFKTLFPTFLILGITSLVRNVNAEQLTYIDVRQNGGGLTEATQEQLAELLNEYPELQWIGDSSFHGRPLPVHGASLIDLPYSILDEAGGNFTRASAEELVKRHMAAGSAPIIRYYHTKPKIVLAEYDSIANTIDLDWTPISEADGYRIYLGEQIDGPFMSIDLTLDDITLSEESGFVSAINVAVTVAIFDYLYVAPLVNNSEWPQSDIIRLDTSTEGDSFLNILNANLISPPIVTTTLNANLVTE